MLGKINSGWENTNWGLALFLISIILPALGVVAHCTVQIFEGKALEHYDLVIMDHPILTNWGATYLEVLIGDVLLLVVLIVGLIFRHLHYGDERDFMKKYNIKGKTGFTRDFKDPGSTRSDYSNSDFSDD